MTTTDSTTDTGSTDSTSTSTTDTTGTDSKGTDRTFTQSELDKIVQDRLARAKAEPPADYADLQAKAAKLAEIEAANLSELEKVTARAEAAEKSAAEATERARKSARQSAIVASATKAGAVDPDAVVALLAIDAVTVGDDGQVTGADDAVKALLESKPYLVGKAPTGSTDGGPRGSGGTKQLTRDDLAGMKPEAIEAARKAGQLNDVMGIR